MVCLTAKKTLSFVAVRKLLFRESNEHEKTGIANQRCSFAIIDFGFLFFQKEPQRVATEEEEYESKVKVFVRVRFENKQTKKVVKKRTKFVFLKLTRSLTHSWRTLLDRRMIVKLERDSMMLFR